MLQRIAHPDTRIVSLTVTEKGYCHDPATGTLQWQHPDIVHDLAHAAAPRSAIGFIVHGLALRRATGLGPITLMSLDNLPANGLTLRGLVLRLIHRTRDPLVLVGDMNDGPQSVTSQMVAATDAVAWDRQALHAAVLGFIHPVTGAQLRFESTLPADMTGLLVELRRNS